MFPDRGRRSRVGRYAARQEADVPPATAEALTSAGGESCRFFARGWRHRLCRHARHRRRSALDCRSLDRIRLRPSASGARPALLRRSASICRRDAGWLAAVAGFARRRAAGEGKGRFAVIAWGAGIALLVLGNLTSLALHAFVSGSDAVYDDNPLFAVGGILSLLGALAAGVVVARAQRLRRWRRWVVLVYAFYYLLALFVPLFLGHEPNFVSEVLWGLAWCGVALALVRAERDDGHARPQ
jgi:hypothetical protein